MKAKRFKNFKLNNNLYLTIIFIVLGLITIFSITNLITVIELKRQVNLILDNSSVVDFKASRSLEKIAVIKKTDVDDIVEQEILSQQKASSSVLVYNLDSATYSNVTSEPFFNKVFIDGENTNMHFDERVTALTFKPIFSFKKDGDCEELFCGLLINQNNELRENQGQIFYNDKKIDFPIELKDKKIVNFNFSKLEKKWIIGLVTIEGGREVGYAYLFNGQTMQPLITSDTEQKIKTQYGYTGGSISAGGSDAHFLILYSGFEGLGYLYNNGSWQNLSQFFGLRVTSGGFRARIIKGGYGNLANWYVCSDTVNKPKLIKLWQNDTATIQGAIDLSDILGFSTAICASNGNRELKIAFNNSGIESSAYNFVDKGFDNNQGYSYQSVNLSNFVDRKITNVQFKLIAVSAPKNMYEFSVSSDLKNWISSDNYNFILENASSSSFYIKADFKTRESEYSPWFGGLDLITYSAKDLK